MWTVLAASVRARQGRLLAASTAIVLGVTFLFATLVMGDTMRAGYDRAFTQANAGTAVVVRSSVEMGEEEMAVRDLVDASLVDRVGAVDGVAAAVGLVEGTGTIVAADGDPIGGDGPPTVATSWIDVPALNPYRIAEGRAPTADGEAVIDRRAADAGDLHVGDHTRVLTPGPVDVEIVGIVTFGDADSLGPTTYVAFTPDEARLVLLHDRPGVSAILVAAEEGVSPSALRDELAPLLPARTEALTEAERTAEQNADVQDAFLSFFEAVLLAFAGIAVVVAAFSIHNTFSILVAQRTRESALLRAVGAARRQILAAVAGEALVVGAAASALGLGLGLALAQGLNLLLDAAGFSASSGGLVVRTVSLVVAAAVGVLTTVVATVGPAVRASRVAPLAALRDVAVDRSGSSTARAVLGTFLTGAGIALVVTATTAADRPVAQAGVGGLVLLVGAVVVGPVLARPAAAVLGTVLGRGLSGRLARRNALRSPRRVAGSASALLVGTAVVAVFATFAASLKATMSDAVGSFSGDLVLMRDGFSGAGITNELAPALDALDEVDDSVGVAFGAVELDGAAAEPAVSDPAALAAMFDLDERAGSLAGLAPGEVAVSDHYADEHGLRLGGAVAATFVDGTTTHLTVGAVYGDRFTFGDVLMTPADWQPHDRQAGDTVVFVSLAPGVGELEGRAAVDRLGQRFGAPTAQNADEYLDARGEQIDQMLTLVYALLAVAIVIALLGIATSLSLAIHERTRELGLLRAVGQSRRQVRAMVRRESMIIALFGTTGGLAVGTFLGWGVLRALRAQTEFGTFALPAASLGAIVVLAAAAGVLAAVRPARRAARLDVLDAIATD